MVRNLPSPSTEHMQAAEFPAHNGCVMQGFADGNVGVIGHGGQNVKFSHSHEDREKQLGCTIVRNSLVPGDDFPQKSRDTHSSEGDF